MQLKVAQDGISLLIDGWYVFLIDSMTGKGFLAPYVSEETQLALDDRNRIKLSNE